MDVILGEHLLAAVVPSLNFAFRRPQAMKLSSTRHEVCRFQHNARDAITSAAAFVMPSLAAASLTIWIKVMTMRADDLSIRSSLVTSEFSGSGGTTRMTFTEQAV